MSHPICQSEDQGGHPSCDQPATFRTVGADPVRYFCERHRERFYRKEDTRSLPITAELVKALIQARDKAVDDLNNHATQQYHREKEDRDRICRKLGIDTLLLWDWIAKKIPERLAEIERKGYQAGYQAAIDKVESKVFGDPPT